MELMVIRAKESSRVCVGRGNVNGIKGDTGEGVMEGVWAGGYKWN